MLSLRCSDVVVSEYAPHGLYGDYPLQQQTSEFCILLKYILYHLDILFISKSLSIIFKLRLNHRNLFSANYVCNYLPAVDYKVDRAVEDNQQVAECHHDVHFVAPNLGRVLTFNLRRRYKKI